MSSKFLDSHVQITAIDGNDWKEFAGVYQKERGGFSFASKMDAGLAWHDPSFYRDAMAFFADSIGSSFGAAYVIGTDSEGGVFPVVLAGELSRYGSVVCQVPTRMHCKDVLSEIRGSKLIGVNSWRSEEKGLVSQADTLVIANDTIVIDAEMVDYILQIIYGVAKKVRNIYFVSKASISSLLSFESLFSSVQDICDINSSCVEVINTDKEKLTAGFVDTRPIPVAPGADILRSGGGYRIPKVIRGVEKLDLKINADVSGGRPICVVGGVENGYFAFLCAEHLKRQGLKSYFSKMTSRDIVVADRIKNKSVLFCEPELAPVFFYGIVKGVYYLFVAEPCDGTLDVLKKRIHHILRGNVSGEIGGMLWVF